LPTPTIYCCVLPTFTIKNYYNCVSLGLFT